MTTPNIQNTPEFEQTKKDQGAEKKGYKKPVQYQPAHEGLNQSSDWAALQALKGRA